jgi:hypothetical protein
MAQRNAVLISAVVVTAVIAAGLTAVILEKFRADTTADAEDKETWLRLGRLDANRPCELVEKASFRAKNGKKVTWRIENLCADAQTVTIGNVRAEKDENVQFQDCKEAASGVPFPFDPPYTLNDRQQTVGPNENGKKIEFKAKHPGTSTNPEVFYFDICLGTGNGKKVDPRLIIDP